MPEAPIFSEQTLDQWSLGQEEEAKELSLAELRERETILKNWVTDLATPSIVIEPQVLDGSAYDSSQAQTIFHTELEIFPQLNNKIQSLTYTYIRAISECETRLNELRWQVENIHNQLQELETNIRTRLSAASQTACDSAASGLSFMDTESRLQLIGTYSNLWDVAVLLAASRGAARKMYELIHNQFGVGRLSIAQIAEEQKRQKVYEAVASGVKEWLERHDRANQNASDDDVADMVREPGGFGLNRHNDEVLRNAVFLAFCSNVGIESLKKAVYPVIFSGEYGYNATPELAKKLLHNYLWDHQDPYYLSVQEMHEMMEGKEIDILSQLPGQDSKKAIDNCGSIVETSYEIDSHSNNLSINNFTIEVKGIVVFSCQTKLLEFVGGIRFSDIHDFDPDKGIKRCIEEAVDGFYKEAINGTRQDFENAMKSFRGGADGYAEEVEKWCRDNSVMILLNGIKGLKRGFIREGARDWRAERLVRIMNNLDIGKDFRITSPYVPVAQHFNQKVVW